jgi:hypothetical protein
VDLIYDFYDIFLRDFWRGKPEIIADPWKYVAGGLAAIVGFWLAWFPARVVVEIIQVILDGPELYGISGMVRSVHTLWIWVLGFLTLGCCVTIPASVWHSIARHLSPNHSQLVARVGATASTVATVLLFGVAGAGTICLMIAGQG